jgi:hypothetical protein
VRRQLAHAAEDQVSVLVRELYALALGDHLQRRFAYLSEVRVRSGHGGDEGGLQKLQEPDAPHARVAEGPLEVGVERPEVEQRLVHVEEANPRHAPSLSTALPAMRSPP